jgi:hypothetical protein
MRMKSHRRAMKSHQKVKKSHQTVKKSHHLGLENLQRVKKNRGPFSHLHACSASQHQV